MTTPARPTNVRWVVFALASATSWLLYLHRYTFSNIKPKLMEQWQVNEFDVGLIDSAFSLTSTGFQIPLGVSADLYGVRLVLSCLIVVWCLGLGLHAWAPGPRYLVSARLLLGLGQSAVYACLSRIAQTWFPARFRTTMQATAAITFGRLGGLSSYILFTTVLLGTLGMDWRTATYLFAGSGITFAVVFAALYRNSPRGHPLVNEAEVELIGQAAAVQPRMSVRNLLGSIQPRELPNFLALNVQTILSTFADNIYSNWMPAFLYGAYKLKDQANGLYSALPLLGGAVAGLCGGWLNDRCIAWTGNRRWSRRGIALVGKGLAAVLLLVGLIWYDRPLVFCCFLFAVKFFGDWSLATSWGVITDIGGRATASVFAVNNTVAGLGLLAAPPLIGLVARDYGWPAVFVMIAAAYVLCALSWLAIDCTRPLLED